jgi:glucose/arabinose dehydrogenase
MRSVAVALLLAAGFLASLLWLPAEARTEVGEVGPTDYEIEVYAGGVTFPVTMKFAPDGRLFFNERFVGASPPVTGTIRVIGADGTLQERPFAVIEVAETTPDAEQGLLGLALDPDFESNGYLYAYRTGPPDDENPVAHGEILRFTSVLSGTDWIGTEMTRIVEWMICPSVMAAAITGESYTLAPMVSCT